MLNLIEFAKPFCNNEPINCFIFIMDFFEKLDGKPLNFALLPDEINEVEIYAKSGRTKSYLNMLSRVCDIAEYPCGYWPLSIVLFKDMGNTAAHMGIYLGENMLIHGTQKGVRLTKFSFIRKSCSHAATFKEGIRDARPSSVC
jgi:hypothetical protein